MTCNKHKPTGRGGCQRGAVSQGTCGRKAVSRRVTRGGVTVRLCARCDAAIGGIVGVPA